MAYQQGYSTGYADTVTPTPSSYQPRRKGGMWIVKLGT